VGFNNSHADIRSLHLLASSLNMATTDTTAPASGIDATPTGNPSVEAGDPLSTKPEGGNSPFGGDTERLESANGTVDVDESAIDDTVRNNSTSLSPPESPRNRRMSREWDASKVPPSQFQKRKGSIYSTPGSRDSQHGDKNRDKAYHDKLKEKGWKLFGKK
jgi:hypothetical protein